MRISDWSSDVCSSDLAPARRRQQAQVDAIVLGQSLVAVGLDHLQVVHAPVKARQQQALRAAQQQSAARERPLAFVVFVLLQHGCPRPLPSGGTAAGRAGRPRRGRGRSEEHTSELQSLMSISYAVFCLKKKTKPK